MSQLIIIAGKDTDLRERLFRALSAPGRIIVETSPGPAVLELMEAEMPELLVLDSGAPDAALATMRVIREQQVDVAVILLTDAEALTRIAGPAASAGASAVLSRSAPLDSLIDHVDRALDQQLEKTGLPFPPY